MGLYVFTAHFALIVAKKARQGLLCLDLPVLLFYHHQASVKSLAKKPKFFCRISFFDFSSQQLHFRSNLKYASTNCNQWKSRFVSRLIGLCAELTIESEVL